MHYTRNLLCANSILLTPAHAVHIASQGISRRPRFICRMVRCACPKSMSRKFVHRWLPLPMCGHVAARPPRRQGRRALYVLANPIEPRFCRVQRVPVQGDRRTAFRRQTETTAKAANLDRVRLLSSGFVRRFVSFFATGSVDMHGTATVKGRGRRWIATTTT
jgi:hypothetical protein